MKKTRKLDLYKDGWVVKQRVGWIFWKTLYKGPNLNVAINFLINGSDK